MSIDKKSSYYDVGGIETIDILKAKLTEDQYVGYLLGNLIKYSSRANHKGSFHRDIEKVSVYSKELSELGNPTSSLTEKVINVSTLEEGYYEFQIEELRQQLESVDSERQKLYEENSYIRDHLKAFLVSVDSYAIETLRENVKSFMGKILQGELYE